MACTQALESTVGRRQINRWCLGDASPYTYQMQSSLFGSDMMGLDEIRIAYPGGTCFKFGDSEELCSKLLMLVRIGRKVATCGALRDFESGDEQMPQVGRTDVALNWDGTPALAIRTTAVSLSRFCDVDESFALAEGEDETLEGWRIGHKQFFERNGGFDSKMILVCERFKLVADFAAPN